MSSAIVEVITAAAQGADKSSKAQKGVRKAAKQVCSPRFALEDADRDVGGQGVPSAC